MNVQDKTQPGRRGRPPRPRADGDAVDKAYQGMRDLILSYDIRPGERLNELELASRIGVSRTEEIVDVLKEGAAKLYIV